MEGDLLTSGYGISPSSALSALQGSQVTSMIIIVLLLSVSYLILTLSQSHNNVIKNILENKLGIFLAWSLAGTL